MYMQSLKKFNNNHKNYNRNYKMQQKTLFNQSIFLNFNKNKNAKDHHNNLKEQLSSNKSKNHIFKFIKTL
jgi:hypothetical protein